MTTKAKQPSLDGMEEKLIKDVVASAEVYQEIRDERMEMTVREVEAQANLLAAMKAHDLTDYQWNGKRIYIVTGKEKVRVRDKNSKNEERNEE